MQCWHHYSNDVIRHALDQMESLHNWQVINKALVLKNQVTVSEVRNHTAVFTPHSLVCVMLMSVALSLF